MPCRSTPQFFGNPQKRIELNISPKIGSPILDLYNHFIKPIAIKRARLAEAGNGGMKFN